MYKASYNFIILLIFVSVVLASCFPGKHFSNWDEKEIQAVYSGGHKWDVSLTLYRDSTFRYVIKDDMIGIPKIKTGAYLMNDTSITLYTWQAKYMSRQSNAEVFRIRGSQVLMYPEEKEKGADANFIRDYYTLTLEKKYQPTQGKQ
jgi:hypothetical protein